MLFKTTAQRSRNMRAIRAESNATTEWRLRALLIRNRITGWKVREKAVSGCPDFFFHKRNLPCLSMGAFGTDAPPAVMYQELTVHIGVKN